MTSSVSEIMRNALLLHKAGQLAQAKQLYEAILQVDGDNPDAHHNLGLIALQHGQTETGLECLRRALVSDRRRPLHWRSYANALKATGYHDEAATALRDALTGEGPAQPISGGIKDVPPRVDGSISGNSGDISRAAASTAMQASSLCETGQPVEAIASLRARLGISSRDPDLHYQLGNALAAIGLHDDAIQAYRAALSLDPAFADAHLRLGSLLSESGNIQEGFAHFMCRARLAFGEGNPASGIAHDPPHKVKHDREQREYLTENVLSQKQSQQKAIFHLGDGERIPGPVLNPANSQSTILSKWWQNKPQMVVLDDFLNPDALVKLRAYCAESTIWRRIYDAGYIGAIPADGFACPLLAQLAEEISCAWPAIFEGHRFKYLGGFKYDSELSTGTNTHADFAAVNVNFYIAPDEANLDTTSGGIKIWDCCVENEEQMRLLNSDEEAMEDYLSRCGARAIRVPHRANRAVIFRSNLIHKTDEFRFLEGYLKKRINISLLYGEFSEGGG
jgi:tetratricopeptide (TPR) repeat protein